MSQVQIVAPGATLDTQPDTQHAYVPHNQLILSPSNVRKRRSPSRISALAASIEEQGLLQNLVVVLVTSGKDRGKYEVTAGGYRYLAIGLLIKEAKLPQDTPVAVRIRSQSDALLDSLAENEQREAMHPADQFDAFKALVDSGKSVEFVASLFGTTAQTVSRRLKLASTSPALFELFREDKIDIEQMMALALSDSHEQQERIWFDATTEMQRRPANIRSAIVGQAVSVQTDRFAKFVGIEAYEGAGGFVRRDLFSDEASGYFDNVELLQRLAAEKLESIASQVRAEGWGWVEIVSDLYEAGLFRLGRLDAEQRKPTKEERGNIKALEDELKRLQERMDAMCDDSTDNDDSSDASEYYALEEKIDSLVERIEAINANLVVYEADSMKHAGVLISVDRDGQPEIVRGLVRREDRAEVLRARGDEKGAAQAEAEGKPKERPTHSDRLVRKLTAHRTLAMQAEMAANVDVALTALVCHLASPIFYVAYRGESMIKIHATCAAHSLPKDDDVVASEAWKAMTERKDQWKKQLPKSEAKLFDWLAEQSQATRLELLAFCTASTLDGVQGDESKLPGSNLATALALDMAKWWKATEQTYFDHVSKAQIATVVKEVTSAKDAADIPGMKKSDAAKTATQRVGPARWLPKVLRTTPKKK